MSEDAKSMSERSPSSGGDDQDHRHSADLMERFVEFAIRIGRLVDSLPDSRMGRHVAEQLIRAGTMPAASYSEGIGVDSRKDFEQKLNRARTELRETRTWLMIIKTGELLPVHRLEGIVDECEELEKILASEVLAVDFGRQKSDEE